MDGREKEKEKCEKNREAGVATREKKWKVVHFYVLLLGKYAWPK